MTKTKCPQCLKTVLEDEIDNCDNCGKNFCLECLIYQGKLAFCENCSKR